MELPDYEGWRATCDTLHAHTQVLGKLAAVLAPPEPQLQHAALRLTVRGWETLPLPAPDGSGAFSLILDLHAHEAVVDHIDGRGARIPLTPHRSVGAVTRDVLEAVRELAGDVPFDAQPQEVPWTVALDADEEHATYDAAQVGATTRRRTRAAQILAAFRAPYRGRSTPVNAWWGSFDLAVSLFSGEPAQPPADDFIMRNAMDAQEVAVGWWPGDARYGRAAFYAYAHPAPDGLRRRRARARRRALGRRARRVPARLGRRDWRAPTRTRPAWPSRARPSRTRARSATGIRRCRRAPRASLRRSSSRVPRRPRP